MEMFRQPQPQPPLNHAVLKGPLGELVALLIHDHPIHHVGVPQGLGPQRQQSEPCPAAPGRGCAHPAGW